MNMQHQTIFFEIKAFPTEKNRFLSVFFISKKSQRCSKKPEFQNLASKMQNWQPWIWVENPAMDACWKHCVKRSARHVRRNSELMRTTLFPSNLYKNSFCDCVGVKYQKKWNVKILILDPETWIIGCFKLCWLLPDSSAEIWSVAELAGVTFSDTDSAPDQNFWIRVRCQTKFLTCEISDFTPFAHAPCSE